jgi:glyoxylase-like metal-dependent hydrolase (beta-lactamase superfamily II)
MHVTRFDFDALSQMLGFDVSRRMLLRHLAGGGIAATIAAGSLRVAPGAAAQEATPTPIPTPPNRAHRFRLGQLALRVFDDGEFVLPFDWFATNARPRALAAAVAQGNLPTDAIPLRINNLLVETGGHLVLIDTGYGSIDPNPGAGKLPLALQAEGIVPEDIDIVLLTHLHPDHVGGTLDEAGKPAFPNARYLVNRVEHEYWLTNPSLVELPIGDDFKQYVRQVGKDTAVALSNKIERVEPGDEVAPGITVVAAPGHTPGHLAVEVASGGERLLHIADTASVSVLHLLHPDWFTKVELWPAQSLMTRYQLLDRAAAENLLVQTYHLPFPGLGHVRADGDDWLWEPVAA